MKSKTHFLVLLACIFVLAAGCSSKKEPVTVYMWQRLSLNENPDTLAARFKEWKSHGVTGVCIDGRNLEQTKMASALAHAEGLEYHAWVPSMLRSGMPHEWYAVNRLGQSADENPTYVNSYRFLDPANPEVQEYLIEQYTAVASLPDVDYVRLDFIRYPDVILAEALSETYGLEDVDGEYAPADYCYCEHCVGAFFKETGIDITKVKDPGKVEAWAQFRCDQLTFFVDKVANAVHQVGKKVSVDVFPGPYSYAEHMVRQQWDQWMVDAFFPMNYNDMYEEGPEWVASVVAEEVEAVGGVPVVSSLRLCKDWQTKSQTTHVGSKGLLPSELGTAVRGAVASGAKGVCLFSGVRMTPEYWEALDEVLKELSK